MSTIIVAVSQNLSDCPCWCLPHSRLLYLLVSSLQFPGSVHDFSFSCLEWTWLHTHNTGEKIAFTLIHCPHAECTQFCLCPVRPAGRDYFPQARWSLHNSLPLGLMQGHISMDWTGLRWNAIFVQAHSEKLSMWGLPWKTRVDRTINEGNPKTEPHKSILRFLFLSDVSSFILQYSVSD